MPAYGNDLSLRSRRCRLVIAALGPILLVVLAVVRADTVLAPAMKSVYVLDLNRADRTEVRQALERDVLKAPLTAYLPVNKYIVCLSGDQLEMVKTMKVEVDLLPRERRLGPGLDQTQLISSSSAITPSSTATTTTTTPTTELILQLCDNTDRNLGIMLADARPALDALHVAVEPVSDNRLKARLLGTTALPATVAASLIDVLGEIVWVEKKSAVILL